MTNKQNIQIDLAFIIEDDRDIADTYAQAVREAGYEVEVFYDGGRAYERLQRDPAPNLVLLDMHLPVTTGNEIAWEMWFELDQTHIIIITADADMASIYRTKQEVDEVFVKPVPLDVIRDVSKRYLDAGKRDLSSELTQRS